MAFELGADHVLRQTEDLVGQVRSVNNGHLADVVLDTLGGGNATRCLDLLKFNGALVCIVEFPEFDRLHWFERGVTLHEIALGAAYRHGEKKDIEDIAIMLEELLALVVGGAIRPLIAETILLEEIPDGLERLRNRAVRPGKVVAVVQSHSATGNTQRNVAQAEK